MTHSINSNNRSTNESLRTQSSAARSNATSTGSNASAAPNAGNTAQSATADTVSLSASSIQVRELQNRLANIPEVDAQKVAQIKQEIANGNYPLDSKAIAANLLNLEKALSE